MKTRLYGTKEDDARSNSVTRNASWRVSHEIGWQPAIPMTPRGDRTARRARNIREGSMAARNCA
jgi:hypothetical protein